MKNVKPKTAADQDFDDLKRIAVATNKIHDEITDLGRKKVYKYRDAGALILQAKAKLQQMKKAGKRLRVEPGGEVTHVEPMMKNFVPHYLSFSWRTANVYMRVARNWKWIGPQVKDGANPTLEQLDHIITTGEPLGGIITQQQGLFKDDEPVPAHVITAKDKRAYWFQQRKNLIGIMHNVVRALPNAAVSFLVHNSGLELRYLMREITSEFARAFNAARSKRSRDLLDATTDSERTKLRNAYQIQILNAFADDPDKLTPWQRSRVARELEGLRVTKTINKERLARICRVAGVAAPAR